jgi:hypothetical protein
MDVSGGKCMFHILLASCFMLVSCLTHSTLKMGVTCFPEISVDLQLGYTALFPKRQEYSNDAQFLKKILMGVQITHVLYRNTYYSYYQGCRLINTTVLLQSSVVSNNGDMYSNSVKMTKQENSYLFYSFLRHSSRHNNLS